IKEGLNNIIRHSDATLVTLALLEHPALYQLVLQDNGTGLASRPGLGPRGGAASGAGASGATPGAGTALGFGAASEMGADLGFGATSGERAAAAGDGLGLRSMEDRVTALGGQFLVEHQGGFRLFVSVPKRRTAPRREAAP
ncbi:MAG TPA: hypothetical protein GX515_13260, partial [Firmicutes bacterium]|nr:hypothetical protein [Bacillota bacterium]